MTGSILTINGGSSSLKFALFENSAELTTTVRGEIEDLDAAPHLLARDAAGAVLAERRWSAGSDAHPFAVALDALLNFADAHLGRDGLVAVGHRVVHGGADHIAPEMITPALVALLETLTPLDPLHMPDNLAPMRAVMAARPQLAQVACFDTAFHHTMSSVAARFALPRALETKGVRRYGFHGLSYEYFILPEDTVTRFGARTSDRGAPRFRRQLMRAERRQQHRHDHRFQRAGRIGHGHALREPRSRCDPLSWPAGI
jgi:acetate kinase